MATPSSDYSAIVEQIYTAMQEKGYNGTMADLALALSTLSDDNPATTKWIDLGASSAYAIYVEHGGTMTESEWIEYLSTVSEQSAQAHADAQSAKESAEAAEQAKTDVTEEAEHAITDIQTEGQTQITAVTNKGTEQVGAVNTAGTTQVNAVNAAGTTQVTAVNTAGSTQVTAVQAQGTTSKDAVTAEGEKQVERVSNQGTVEVQAVTGEGTRQTGLVTTEGNTQVARVTAEGTTQMGNVQTKGQEVLASIPQDYTELSDDVDDIKSAITIIEENDYNFSAISINASANGWKLIDSGLCTSDSNYTLNKYKVKAGDVVRVISDYKFQFQNAASVPSTGTSNRVGATYNNGTFLLEVPTGATYLIISTPETGSTAAYLGESKNSKQDADIILLDKNKAEKSAVGFNVWDEQWETNDGGTYIRSKNLIEVMPGTVYYLYAPNDFSNGVKQYNANKEVIKTTYPSSGGTTLTTESSTKYLSFAMSNAYGTTYNNNICINISQPNANIEPHNGQYVPYGYIGIYRDVLKNKSDIYTQVQAFNTEKSNTVKTLLNVSQKTGTTLKDISTHSHSTVLNQSTTQTNISIPKNYKVTISFSDANVEGNGAVYLKYKNSESAIILVGSILMNGGSYTFVTTDETEYFSLYKNTGVTTGMMTITIDYHYEDSLIGLPTHYVDHMVTKTASVLSNMITAGKNGETFIFISDLHWENNVRNSPALVKYLLDNLNINFLLCGGDIINEGLKDDEAKTMVECIRAFNFKNIFLPCAFGNHDSNKNGSNSSHSERWFDENAEYALMQKQAEDHITYFTETGWNFYFDSEQTKTRWIVCDTQENGTFSWYDELCSLLNETPEGYHVIISGHWFYGSGSKSTFAVNLESIVDAFNARSSATIGSTPYSFANAKGSIPFVIGGHMHKDMDWATSDGIPFILVDCDNGPRSGNTDYPYAKGTITEQAFDVVTVDYTNETIKCVRIGRGADRNFTY